MAAAALTPRVRVATVCDRARESTTEAGVYHLRGVRQSIVAPAFPFAAHRLQLYFVLSSPRSGTFPGYIRVIDDATEKAIFFTNMTPHPQFDDGGGSMAYAIRLKCAFPRAGSFAVQIWFFQESGSDVLKFEVPFQVFEEGD
jgi:hypothetical protein